MKRKTSNWSNFCMLLRRSGLSASAGLSCSNKMDIHVNFILSLCNQRMHLLKLLRSQGLSSFQLDQVSHAIIISRLRYALPVWSGFLSIDLINRIQSMLKRFFKYGYITSLISFQDLINSCSVDLFQCMNRSNHCLHHILSRYELCSDRLRPRGYNCTLPTCTNNLHRQSSLIEFYLILCNICYIVFVLPARRYASAGNSDCNVSVRLSVLLFVCHEPV